MFHLMSKVKTKNCEKCQGTLRFFFFISHFDDHAKKYVFVCLRFVKIEYYKIQIRQRAKFQKITMTKIYLPFVG